MACLLPPTTYTTTGGRPRKNLSFNFFKNINSCWTKLTKSQARKKLSLTSPKSPVIKRPKQLFVTLSNNLRHKKKADEDEIELDFGDGGLWQRSILMGDKCQPLDFSGVIYYDNSGKRTAELPMKSPRASPLPSYYYAA